MKLHHLIKNHFIKNRSPRAILIFVSLGLLNAGCFPSAARTNARINTGFDAEVGGQVDFAFKKDRSKKENDGYIQLDDNENNVWGNGELDLQLGKRWENNFGIAFQVKGLYPSWFMSAADLYVELPSTEPWFYGVGFESTIFNFDSDRSGTAAPFGPYIPITYFFNESQYMTYTSRLYFNLVGRPHTQYWINNQLAFGLITDTKIPVDFHLFAAHTYITEGGYDSRSSGSRLIYNQFLQLGFGIRF